MITKLAAALLSIVTLTNSTLPAEAGGHAPGVGSKPLYLSYVWVQPTTRAPRERSRAATIDRHRYVASIRGPRGTGWSCTPSGAGGTASCAVQ